MDDDSPLYILTFAEQAEGRVVSSVRLVLTESPFYVLGDSYELSLEEVAP